MPRLNLQVIIFAFLGIAAGASIGMLISGGNWQDAITTSPTIVGAIGGLVAGLLLRFYLGEPKKRWVAASLLVVVLIASYVVGKLPGLLLSVTSIIVTYGVSATIIKDLYGGDELKALKHHFQLLLTMEGQWQIIDEGRTVVPTETGPLFGPRQIMVKPEHAVTMERGSSITRICGPSIISSNDFELVKEIITLQPHCWIGSLKDTLTNDMVPVKIEVSATYGPKVSLATRTGDNATKTLKDGSTGLTRTERDNIQALTRKAPKMHQQVRNAIGACVRKTVAQHEFEKLFEKDAADRLENEIKTMVAERVSHWGVRIYALDINAIQPSKDVLDARQDLWLADTRKAILKQQELARGEAWSAALQALADGYRDAKANGMTNAEIHREMLRRVLEEITSDSIGKVAVSQELDSDLLELRRILNEKKIEIARH